MSSIRLTLVLIFFCVFSVHPADDLSRTALIQGVNHARLQIGSGEVQYLLSLNYAAEKSEQEITAWMQAEKQKELKEWTPDPFFPDIGVKEFEEQYLIPNLNDWAARYRERTEIEKTSLTFEILTPDPKSFPELYQYKMTIQEHPEVTLKSSAAHFLAGLFYCLSYDTQLQVKEDIGNIAFATPSVQNDYAGFHHIWAFGRAAYRVPDSAKHLGKRQIDGVTCDVLSYETENGKHVKIWIDPTKAFCIRRFEVRRDPGAPVADTIGTYKKFQRFGDLWYPTVIQYTPNPEEGGVLKSYGFQILRAEFNVDFPKDFFKIDGDFYQRQSPRGGVPGFGGPQTPLQNDTDDL